MSHLQRRRLRTTFLALVIVILLAGPPAAASNPFASVPSGHWAYPALEVLGDAGLLDLALSSDSDRLTRYEVAGLVAQAVEELEEGEETVPSPFQAEVALARLYRLAGRLEGSTTPAGEPIEATGLDRLQGRRQLYWLVPTIHRLERAYREVPDGSSQAAVWQVSRAAAHRYDRLLQVLPESLAPEEGSEVERLERALAGRLAEETPAPADLAARVDQASRALLQLESGFGSELRNLGLEEEAVPELPAARPPDVATLDDVRELVETGRTPAGGAGLEAQVPLGSDGTLEARLGLESEVAASEAGRRMDLDVGLGLDLGEARLYAGWRLVDFSDEGLAGGEGQAGVELPF